MKTKIFIFLALFICFLSTFPVKLAFAYPPTANNDSYSTNEDTTLNIASPGVLANDNDPDVDSLSAVLESGPTEGSLARTALKESTTGSLSFANTPGEAMLRVVSSLVE